MPHPVSSFVGREDDLRQAARLLGEVRLITLWGPGGVGKARLALELAAEVGGRYADGVHFCDLAVVDRPADVTRAVATGIRLQEKAFQRLEAQLLDHLWPTVGSGRPGQLRARAGGAGHSRNESSGSPTGSTSSPPAENGSASTVSTFGRSNRCRRAGTTRQAWACSWTEHAPPTRHSKPGDRISTSSPTSAAGWTGCRWASSWPPPGSGACHSAQLRDSLDQRLQILTAGSGRHRRHRSLAAALDWSYGELEQYEQTVLDRLATFSGPFDLEAARSVASGDGIGADEVTAAVLRLLDCALIVEHPGPGVRRYFLLDTVRRYGIGHLDACGAATAQRERHATWAVSLAERAERGLNSANEATWADALRGHLDDLRAAQTWLVGRDTGASIRLVAALRAVRALATGAFEVFRWAEVAAAAGGGARSPRLSEALLSASTGAWQRGDLDAATVAAQAATDVARHLDPPSTRASLEARADVLFLVGDLEQATTLFTEAAALAVDQGDLLQAVWDLGSASLSIGYGGDTQRARDVSREVFILAERCASPSGLAFAHFVAGEILAADEPHTAELHLLEAIGLAESVDSRFVVGLAEVALAASKVRQQDVATALDYYQSAIEGWQRAGAWTPLWVTLRTVIALLARVGASREAALLYGAALSAHAGVPPFGVDAATMRDTGARLRSELGEDAFGGYLREGSTLADDDVIALALDALRRSARHQTPT